MYKSNRYHISFMYCFTNTCEALLFIRCSLQVLDSLLIPQKFLSRWSINTARFQKMTVLGMSNTQQANKVWYLQTPEIARAMTHMGQGWRLSSWIEALSDNGLDLPVLWTAAKPVLSSMYTWAYGKLNSGQPLWSQRIRVSSKYWSDSDSERLWEWRKAHSLHAQKTNISFYKN